VTADLAVASVGAVVAELVFDAVGREDLARYAEASGDTNPLHLDPAFARKAGFPDVIVHGMLAMALLGRLVTESFPMRRVLGFSARFGAPLGVGEGVTCRARLGGRDARGTMLELEAAAGHRVVLTGRALLAPEGAGG
jgi:acyl dehydratase